MSNKAASFRRRAIILFFAINLSLLFISLVYAYFVEKSALSGEEFIPCYFKNRLHFYCPGCGSSRALVALLHFDFLRAIILSPGLCTAFLLVVYLDVLALMSIISGEPSYIKRFNPRLIILLIAVFLLNFILKNLLLFGFHIDLIGDFIKK